MISSYLKPVAVTVTTMTAITTTDLSVRLIFHRGTWFAFLDPDFGTQATANLFNSMEHMVFMDAIIISNMLTYCVNFCTRASILVMWAW